MKKYHKINKIIIMVKTIGFFSFMEPEDNLLPITFFWKKYYNILQKKDSCGTERIFFLNSTRVMDRKKRIFLKIVENFTWNFTLGNLNSHLALVVPSLLTIYLKFKLKKLCNYILKILFLLELLAFVLESKEDLLTIFYVD